MRVQVIVPWRGGCPHRESALAWVLDRYEALGLEVTLAPAPAGPWIKAHAVTPAIEASDAELVVVADADVWSDGILAALLALNERPWAVPHQLVLRLTEAATAAVTAGADPLVQPLEEKPYRGVAGGGILVARRDVLLDVPLDPRFVGWGGEDHALGYALTALHGNPWRGTAPLIHLWHPPQDRLTRRVGSRAGDRLKRRYQAARGNPRRMRTLVEEARGQAEDRREQRRGRAAAEVA